MGPPLPVRIPASRMRLTGQSEGEQLEVKGHVEPDPGWLTPKGVEVSGARTTHRAGP
jgi:hypothetical protein